MDGCVVFRDSFTLSTSSTNLEKRRGKYSIMCLHTAMSVTDNTRQPLSKVRLLPLGEESAEDRVTIHVSTGTDNT